MWISMAFQILMQLQLCSQESGSIEKLPCYLTALAGKFLCSHVWPKQSQSQNLGESVRTKTGKFTNKHG